MKEKMISNKANKVSKRKRTSEQHDVKKANKQPRRKKKLPEIKRQINWKKERKHQITKENSKLTERK